MCEGLPIFSLSGGYLHPFLDFFGGYLHPLLINLKGITAGFDVDTGLPSTAWTQTFFHKREELTLFRLTHSTKLKRVNTPLTSKFRGSTARTGG